MWYNVCIYTHTEVLDMDKCELLVALEEAKAKGSLLEISDEFL